MVFDEMRLARGEVTVTIPKFKLEKKTNLKETFTKLGESRDLLQISIFHQTFNF